MTTTKVRYPDGRLGFSAACFQDDNAPAGARFEQRIRLVYARGLPHGAPIEERVDLTRYQRRVGREHARGRLAGISRKQYR